MNPRLVLYAVAGVASLPVLWLANAAALWSLWARHVAPAVDAPAPGLGAWMAILVMRPVLFPPGAQPEVPTERDLSEAMADRLVRFLFAVAVLLVSEVAP